MSVSCTFQEGLVLDCLKIVYFIYFRFVLFLTLHISEFTNYTQ